MFAISNIKLPEFTNLQTMEHSNICIYSKLPKNLIICIDPFPIVNFASNMLHYRICICSINFQTHNKKQFCSLGSEYDGIIQGA